MAFGDEKARGGACSDASAKPVSDRHTKPKLKIWLLSDIHLEFDTTWDLPSPQPDFDVLVVAGDLVTRMERGVKWLRERAGGKDVIYVSGNHEAWGTDVDRTVAKAKQAAAGTSIRILENETCKIGNVRFAGATMWTDFNLFGNPDAAMRAAGEQMNDYKRIRKNNYEQRLRPIDTLRRHGESCSFFASTLADSFRGDTVVVTHHVPLRLRSDCKELSAGAPDPARVDNILDAAYQSDLSYLISFAGPKLWVAGHVHRSVDTTVGATRVVANPKGYPDELNPAFDPRLTIEV